ncbi:hypothetical protein NSQ95_03355 [Psychrobacillus sp. FSL W7-1457]|uniref:hypothetical protein n=1 Tax=unclassified Psychrobacillus TaxID=2636677 RepID=UPI0030FC12FE
MWKKAVPTIALCSFLLVGCNNDEAVPSNNETPMGELNNGNRVITPSPGGDTGNGVGGNGGGAGTGTTDGMNEGNGRSGDYDGNRGINNDDNNGTMGGNNGNGNSTLDMDKGTWVDEPTVDGNGR